MQNIPGWSLLKHCGGGVIQFERQATKDQSLHRLTVINAHQRPLEECLGVDLILHQSAYSSCTLIQYKRLKRYDDGWGFDLNDRQLEKQLESISHFKNSRNTHEVPSQIYDYRLGIESFFIKFCQNEVSDPHSKSLFKGWYVPASYLDLLKSDPSSMGPSGGRRLTEANVERWFSNTEFFPLISSGWIGTCGDATRIIHDMINASLSGNRALVFALSKAVQ
ncbi:MAG: hypothetical protein ACKVYV_03910 [Limisphaerales bacterium]